MTITLTVSRITLAKALLGAAETNAAAVESLARAQGDHRADRPSRGTGAARRRVQQNARPGDRVGAGGYVRGLWVPARAQGSPRTWSRQPGNTALAGGPWPSTSSGKGRSDCRCARGDMPSPVRSPRPTGGTERLDVLGHAAFRGARAGVGVDEIRSSSMRAAAALRAELDGAVLAYTPTPHAERLTFRRIGIVGTRVAVNAERRAAGLRASSGRSTDIHAHNFGHRHRSPGGRGC